MTEIPYGFKIQKVDPILNSFAIYDLAENKKIFDLKYSGLKPKATIYELDNNAVLEIKKKSTFGFSWEISKLEDIEVKKESAVSFSKEIIKKGVKIVDFNKKQGLMTATEVMIAIEKEKRKGILYLPIGYFSNN